MINLLQHSPRGAVIELDQRELLLLMALVQEGTESFGYSNTLGKSLDQFFVSTNKIVEEARRESLPCLT